jgi:hypothetical protein
VFALWAGCATEARVVEEMEAALTAINHAIAGGLLLAELSQDLAVPPATTGTSALRHAGAACPAVSTFADTTTLDFGTTGCVPDGGLLPTVVSGHADARITGDPSGEADVAWTLPGAGAEFLMQVPDALVAGAVEGSLTAGADRVDTRLDGSVDFDGLVVKPDRLRIERDADTVRFDGAVTVRDHGDVALEFDGVVLPISDLTGPCPVAVEGQVVADDDRGADVVLDFDAGRGQLLDVTRRGRASTDTDLCAYATHLL